MFLKVSSSGGHRYVRLVESFRNDNGQPRQRTLATLGRLDEPGGQPLVRVVPPGGSPARLEALGRRVRPATGRSADVEDAAEDAVAAAEPSGSAPPAAG